jgi:hypothetical protein
MVDGGRCLVDLNDFKKTPPLKEPEMDGSKGLIVKIDGPSIDPAERKETCFRCQGTGKINKGKFNRFLKLMVEKDNRIKELEDAVITGNLDVKINNMDTCGECCEDTENTYQIDEHGDPLCFDCYVEKAERYLSNYYYLIKSHEKFGELILEELEGTRSSHDNLLKKLNSPHRQ